MRSTHSSSLAWVMVVVEWLEVRVALTLFNVTTVWWLMLQVSDFGFRVEG